MSDIDIARMHAAWSDVIIIPRARNKPEDASPERRSTSILDTVPLLIALVVGTAVLDLARSSSTIYRSTCS